MPNVIIISAPSGAGKTSLVKALLAADPRLRASVSHTTRAPRPGEVPGQDYHFVSVGEFRNLQAQDEFLESAQVFDNFYGTGRSTVNALLADGYDVILEIDWQGARQVRARIPCQSLFILPPSQAALIQRLRGRGQDSEGVIQRRMEQARAEMRHYEEFDYLIINDDFDTALTQIRHLVAALRLHTEHQRRQHADLIQALLDFDEPLGS